MTADRTMTLERVVKAPPARVWAAWSDPEVLPLWWGPDGFTCRTYRIDLRKGGEWVFDMIGPDGTVYPNRHHYTRYDPKARIDYALYNSETGHKHADVTVTFEETDGGTRVTLSMLFSSVEEHRNAADFGAYEAGMETLGKLAAAVENV